MDCLKWIATKSKEPQDGLMLTSTACTAQVKPGIYVTYNGDFFDWPFIETRAARNGMDMQRQVGFAMTKDNQCLSRFANPHCIAP